MIVKTQMPEAENKPRGADKKEAFHLEAESKVHNFHFKRPPIDYQTDKKKIHVRLAGTNTVRAQIQILTEGGETNLHYHPHADLIYMPVQGRVRFYGAGDKVLGEFGPHEGILLPANSRYWFESIGDEELHLLQIAGFPTGEKHKRVDVVPPKHKDGGRSVWYDAATGKIIRA